MNRKTLAILRLGFWLFVGISGILYAQPAPMAKEVEAKEFPATLIDVQKGLSQGFIYAIAEDSLGYLWIATSDGLNRYDGYQFKVFHYDPADPTSLSNDEVIDLLVDQAGQLWVATNEGVDLYDPKTETFKRVLPVSKVSNGLNKNLFLQIQLLPERKILVYSPGNPILWIIQPIANTTTKSHWEALPIEKVYPSFKVPIGYMNFLHKISTSPDGTIWLRDSANLYRFPPEILEKGLAPEKQYLPFSLTRGHLDNTSLGIINAPEGDQYLVAIHQILKYDRQAKQFLPYLALPDAIANPEAIWIDSQNRMWMIRNHESIITVDLTHQTYQYIILKDPKVEKFIGGIVGIMEDKSHNIWLRTIGYGVVKISHRAEQFRRIPTDIPSRHLKALNYRITLTGKKAVFDPDCRKEWIKLANNIEEMGWYEHIHKGNSIPVRDKEGGYWLIQNIPSSPDQELVQLLRVQAEPMARKVMFEYINHKGEQWNYPFILDQHQKLWFVTNILQERKSWMQFYDLLTGTVGRYPFPENLKYSGGFLIADWYETPQNTFWLATNDGLFYFDPHSQVFEHFGNDPQDPFSLSGNEVFSVEADPRAPDKVLWVGTKSRGLNCLDIEHRKFYPITTEDGLPNDVVYAIQFDSRHNLWLSTNYGLCQFDPLRWTFRNFDEEDGLTGGEYNRYEFSKAADGELFFGAFNGVSRFYPEVFYQDSTPSRIVINQLRLNNQRVDYKPDAEPSPSGFRLTAPIEHMDTLTFRYNHEIIGLGFALLDLTVPSKRKYQYRLIGLDDAWIDAGTSREAVYSQLKPGHYQFEVKGCNSNNVWTPEPARLAIIILPPWWGTLWFRTLLVLALAGLAYTFYRYRLRKLLEVERLRNRIAQDLHDEIGSTLSSISLYSAVMQKTGKNLPEQTHNLLDKIIDSTSQILESMNDMVWTIKASNDGFEQVVNRMRAFAVNLTEEMDIELEFTVPNDVEKLSFHMERRKGIYLIFKEAVNNAVKYSQCKKLSISFLRGSGNLELIIRDDGIGFDLNNPATEKYAMGGNGLKGMEERAQSIHAKLILETAPGKGTEIRLKIPTDRRGQNH